MPNRPLRRLGGAAVAVAIAALVAALFAAILAAASDPVGAGSSLDLGYLVYITVLQASLSTIVSLLAGIAIAWALNRLSFPGHAIVVGIFAVAIVLPGLVVAFGLLTVWGRGGWFGALGVPIFGLGGVVAAHLVLDGAFAARILLARLDAIPALRLKTGQSLGLDAWTRFRVIDWPAIRGTLPGLAAIIFLLAFTSFPIVLLLGGGPAVQTLEVAIYSAIRLDFDLKRAVMLAALQVGLCALIIIATSATAPVSSSIGGIGRQGWHDSRAARLLQWLVLVVSFAGFASPLLATLVDGARGFGDLLADTDFLPALATSLWIAAASAALAVVLALAVAAARAASVSRFARVAIGIPAYAYLAVPAVTLSLGAFVFVRNLGIAPARVAAPVVIIANALLALPFALATLGPAFDAVMHGRGRLIRSLGLGGVRQFTLVEWPLVGRDIGLVFALSFCFSLGDLGVIALFGTQDFTTLPLLMVRALGAYRTDEAAAISALMLVLTLVAFVGLPKLFEKLAHA